MELEFDKEMDAILRRARTDRGVLVGDDPPEKTQHIDADSVAAFVENALPAKTRTLYMEHFADCDRCRRILSQSMLFASEADVKAASVVSAPVVEASIPWYQKLFRTPNLALAMGALVLVFGGFFAFSVIQRRQSDQNASVAQVNDSERTKGGPFASDEAANKPAAAANVPSAPTMANSSNAASMPAANAVPDPVATPAEPLADRRSVAVSKPADPAAGDRPDSGVMTRDEDKYAEEYRPASKAAPPPPAILGGAIASERESKKETDEKSKTNKDDVSTADSVMRKQAEAPRGRDLPPSPAKSGPARSGPVNTQTNQIQNQTFDMPVTRRVGGKTFNNRNGAWYDSAYKNEATINVRRGTEEYKKLDSGLRNIADTIGGTVVLVWKGKAYRVQ